MFRAVSAQQYATHLAPRLLSAGAELVLDSLPLPREGARLLEVGAGAGLLTEALGARAAARGGSVVAADRDWRLLRYIPKGRGVAARVAACPDALPFADHTFASSVGNGLLGNRAKDPHVLRELSRVTSPGGNIVLSGFFAGSFEALLDLLGEVSENEALSELRQRIRVVRESLYDEDQARDLVKNAQLDCVKVGVCERALFFGGGGAVLDDPLVRDIVLPSWLTQEDEELGLHAATLKALASSIDTYFAGQPFCVRIRVGIILAKTPPE